MSIKSFYRTHRLTKQAWLLIICVLAFGFSAWLAQYSTYKAHFVERCLMFKTLYNTSVKYCGRSIINQIQFLLRDILQRDPKPTDLPYLFHLIQGVKAPQKIVQIELLDLRSDKILGTYAADDFTCQENVLNQKELRYLRKLAIEHNEFFYIPAMFVDCQCLDYMVSVIIKAIDRHKVLVILLTPHAVLKSFLLRCMDDPFVSFRFSFDRKVLIYKAKDFSKVDIAFIAPISKGKFNIIIDGQFPTNWIQLILMLAAIGLSYSIYRFARSNGL